MTSEQSQDSDGGAVTGRHYRLLRLLKVVLAILVSLLTLADLLGVAPG